MDREIGKSVAKNTSIMLGAQAVTWISSFVLLMFLPRYLGSEDYGRLYLAISMAMIMGIIIDFGGNYLIPKEVAREKSKTSKILVSYTGVRTIVWGICMAGLLIFSWIAEYSQTVFILILILGFSKLWEGVVKAITSCFQGHEKMEYPSLGKVAQKIFVSAAAVTALILGAGSVTVAVIMVIGVILNLILCVKFLPKIAENLPSFRIDTSFDLLKSSIPYFLWSIFAVIYYRIDAVMLSTLSTEKVVGWYGGAYRFFDIVMFLPSILTTVIFPIFSRLSGREDDKLGDTFQRSLRYMLLTSVPIAILFFFFSENLVQLFYGLEEYQASVIILQVFAPGILFVYIDFILGSSILATGKQKVWAVVGFSAILLNIGLNYWLIPYAADVWSNAGIGAAISTLATEVFVMSGAFILLPKKNLKGFPLQSVWKIIIGGMVMVGTIRLLGETDLFWPLQAASAGILYLAITIGFKVVTRPEQRFFKEFFSRENIMSYLTSKEKQV